MSAAAALRALARSGLLAALAHPLPSLTTVACLAAMLAPLVVGLGVSRGVADQAALSLGEGADLCVSGLRFGRPAPIPVAAADAIRALPGVASVEPRVVGWTSLGADAVPAVVVGVSAERLARGLDGVACAEGRLPRPGATPEIALGSGLAARLGLAAGNRIPPFYRNRAGERVTTISGVLRSDLPMWEAQVLLTTIEQAQAIFDEPGAATSLLVRCDPVYRRPLRETIGRMESLAAPGEAPVRPRVTTRDELEARLAGRTALREGGLALVLVGAFAVAVPLLLVATGLGLSARRRETALLAALGWGPDEIVLRSLVESLVLAVAGWSAAILVAWVWVRGFAAAGIAQVFVPDAPAVPAFDIPFRLAPEAALASAAAAVVVTSLGSLAASWRAASASPAEALR